MCILPCVWSIALGRALLSLLCITADGLVSFLTGSAHTHIQGKLKPLPTIIMSHLKLAVTQL